MNKQSKKKHGIIHIDTTILALFLLLLLGYVALELLIRILSDWHVDAVIRAVMLALICVIGYCGGRLHLQRTQSNKLFKLLFYLFFALYLYLILTFTLMDATLGRGGDFIYNNVKIDDLRTHYIKWFVNLIPFRSIYEVYILGFLKGYVNAYYMLLNLLGNICAFMPLAFFLPLFFKKQRKWYFFLPTVLLCVAVVELLQFAFMVGSCDIDDLILNAGGALALYFLLRLPIFKRLCEKLLQGSFS